MDEAAYVAFSGKRTLVPVVRPGASDTNAVLTGVRTRLLDLVSGIEEGRSHPGPTICTSAATAHTRRCAGRTTSAMSSARLPFDESPDTIEA